MTSFASEIHLLCRRPGFFVGRWMLHCYQTAVQYTVHVCRYTFLNAFWVLKRLTEIGFVYLQREKHEMYPRPGVPRLHGVEVGAVEAVLCGASLAGEVELGELAPLALLDGALDRQRQLDAEARHVRLDLGQVLLTEVLHGVSHRVRLEYRNALQRQYIEISTRILYFTIYYSHFVCLRRWRRQR